MVHHRFISLTVLLVVTMIVGGCGPSRSSPAAPLVAVATSTEASTTSPNPSPDSQSPQISGPQAGSLMSFADGSVLIFIPDPNGADNNGQRGFWINFMPVTNYQYSLCVQSEFCLEIPEGDTTPVSSPAPLDTIQSHLDGEGGAPSIVGPDHAAGYCGWLQARVPMEEEMTAFESFLGSLSANGQAGIQDDTVHSIFGIQDDTVHSPYGIQDDTVRGIFSIQDDTVHGFADGSVHSIMDGVHCVLDHPLAMPQFVVTSPYYDPSVPMEDMSPRIANSQTFCQNGQAFQTIDLELDADESLVSVNGDGHADCQVVNGNRIVCSGGSNTNPMAVAGLLCDGYEGIACQAGSAFDPAGCSNNLHGGPIQGMDDWELDANGILAPVSGIRLPSGGLLGHTLENAVIINGVMVARSLPGNASSSNGVPGNGSDSNGLFAFPPLALTCPQGFYFDGGAQGCASLGAPRAECLAGYAFNSDRFGCESNLPGGNYPGCPAGQLLDPTTGLCDANSLAASPTTLVLYSNVQLSLPDCSASNPGSSCTLSLKYCNQKGYKHFDPNTCTCY